MRIYISEIGKIYYEGQKLKYYDIHGEFVEDVEIVKFIIHRRNKSIKDKYICVKLKRLQYKNRFYTVNVDNLKYYRDSEHI